MAIEQPQVSQRGMLLMSKQGYDPTSIYIHTRALHRRQPFAPRQPYHRYYQALLPFAGPRAWAERQGWGTMPPRYGFDSMASAR